MKVLFAAGHVLGAKVWMGYNEDENMMDLARRKARYAHAQYGIETATFYVTNTSYPAVQDACTGYDIASFEHSNAEAAPVKGTANRVTVYRTVKNAGDGPCRLIGLACAEILNTYLAPIQHKANSSGNDAFGVLGRAMRAGCKDAWLAENGFHTHPATRELLLDPNIRQQIAEKTVDVMSVYYGWKPNTEEGDDMIKYLEKSENVKLWQRALIDAKFDVGIHGADGSFGPDTRAATNAFKNAVGLPVDTPATVTLVEWYAMQAYQMGHFDDGVTQADLDAEKAKTAEAFQTIGILQDEIQGLKVSVANKEDDLLTLKTIEQAKAEILSRY
jgi:hypothetical protein